MLRNYSRNEAKSQLSKNEGNMEMKSNERETITNSYGEDFRTLLNTNRVESNDITAETVRMINSEITSQVSSRNIELRFDLISHVRGTIEEAISEQVLSTIRETLSDIGNSASANLDSASGERHRSPEVTYPK